MEERIHHCAQGSWRRISILLTLALDACMSGAAPADLRLGAPAVLAAPSEAASSTEPAEATAQKASCAETHKHQERWQAGLHYSLLTPDYRAVKPSKEKIIVQEFFMYTSPYSRDIQPYLQEWLRKTSDDVLFIRRPAIVFPHARLQARMYLTLRMLNRDSALHARFFDWVHDPSHYQTYMKHYTSYDSIPVQDQLAHFLLNVRFARENGIDEASFSEAYNSKEIDDEVYRAQVDTYFNDVVNTSTFVVDGKYSTGAARVGRGRDGKIGADEFRELFELLDHLIAVERRARSDPERPSVQSGPTAKRRKAHHSPPTDPTTPRLSHARGPISVALEHSRLARSIAPNLIVSH